MFDSGVSIDEFSGVPGLLISVCFWCSWSFDKCFFFLVIGICFGVPGLLISLCFRYFWSTDKCLFLVFLV